MLRAAISDAEAAAPAATAGTFTGEDAGGDGAIEPEGEEEEIGDDDAIEDMSFPAD